MTTSTSKVRQYRPQSRRAAVRLVSTKNMSRNAWLLVRKQGIGGSDAAAAMGLSPYQSALELWMNKTGRTPNGECERVLGRRAPMYWGNVLEPIIAEQYSKLTGRKVRRVNSVLQHPDEDKHWMLANLDFAIVGSEDTHILECKTAGEFGAKHWRDGVPDYVQCQMQHQLAVTGKQAADVCVLICGQELQIHRIERDDELIAAIIVMERDFWQHVLDDTPPEPDGSESAAEALQRLYPYDNGSTLDWRDNPETNGQFTRLVETRSKLETLNHYEAMLKQALQMQLGEATKAKLDDGHITWRRSKDSTSLNTSKLLEKQPELLKQYPKTRKGSRRFLIHPKDITH
ncbi:MAG: lambda-exonuclease family protein [Saccharospirillum sp.]|uniref:YqaJ viral recombinase family nuclease n=1 Tax=Saccharospirillum sp. TaxID=2033801 RepID=UPI0032991354